MKRNILRILLLILMWSVLTLIDVLLLNDAIRNWLMRTEIQ